MLFPWRRPDLSVDATAGEAGHGETRDSDPLHS